MSALTETRRKLAEARFFFALLKRIEEVGPVTSEALDDEATYFMSALLSAVFSVLEYLGKEGKQSLRACRDPKQEHSLEQTVDDIKRRNGLLYEAGRRGDSKQIGLRNLSVHHKIVDAQHHERTMGTFGSAPYGRLRFGETRQVRSLFVLDSKTDAQVSIVPLMTRHLRELEELVARWEKTIEPVAG